VRERIKTVIRSRAARLVLAGLMLAAGLAFDAAVALALALAMPPVQLLAVL
jgi:hypothetical protein